MNLNPLATAGLVMIGLTQVSQACPAAGVILSPHIGYAPKRRVDCGMVRVAEADARCVRLRVFFIRSTRVLVPFNP